MKKLFFPLLLIANLGFAQVDLNLGLKAYYPFTGNANDISGNNNNPVFNNATLTADRFGNPSSAYHFDGATTYMQVPNSASLNTTNKLSLSAWVKPMGFYSGNCHGNSVIVKGTSSTTPGLYLIWYDDNAGTNGANCGGPLNPAVENFYGAGGMTPPPGYTPYIQTNQWYNVIVTYDGTTVKLYVNCELKYSGPQGGINFTNTEDLFIGKVNNPSFPYWVNGDIDEVRIYDRALTVDEVNVLGGCTIPLTCNNWLSTPNQGSYVTTGDLDITGNQLTVEAVYNRTAPLNGGLYYGHLVSKHSNSSDVNYALLPNGCEITTTNGYKSTFQSCPPDLNKTYHIAMVYDGTNLKYYRNGFLLSQVACTGNLITNNLQTTIAQVAGAGFPPDNQFLGFTNEVRIWNVARTQSQLQTYMDGSLPNPTTQTGLQAYYTFDNLLNKQGNAAYNATLNGASAINATNSNCTFVPDSCAVVTCNNWLKTQASGSSVRIGDLDISGNQVTVEANFNRIAPWSGSYLYSGDIVSKHFGTTDVNYLLRPNSAEITTTNGYYLTPPICLNDLNKTYHVALVYNGSTLKFYRNGFLMSQVPATGNLILNNYITAIGDYAFGPNVGSYFQGYINEVRIWNIARTQAQIQAYMNTSLPNPTTQPGLQAYYTFDDLVNKQGNPAWNGTLSGTATINNINPNCTFVADSCFMPVSCNNWLSTPSDPSYATAGDIDVTGNQLTVEAVFNRTAPPPVPGSYGFLVSKHLNAFDNNYSLWPNGCALTTSTNPQALLAANCDIELNKTYHVAMVYDGTSLKFYRNGFLHSQTPMSGNLINNNLLTQFARNPLGGGPLYQFLGNMNEVRIWNVARTQAQIQTYMNSSLPNPTTTTGLLAYYTFDNLLNKQGNTAFNASLNGAATINATNPNCTFVADSCAVASTAIIINDYTPVLGLNPCDNKLTVEDGTAYNVGDTVLLIQMKGAVIDSTNTAAFGTVTDYKNSGNYEFNYVKSRAGNNIELLNKLTRQYDIPVGKVQLIRVPYYNDLTTTDTLTCLPWNGNKGGVLVFNVLNTLTLNANIDVSGKGFKGAPGFNPGNATLNCFHNNYNYPLNSLLAAQKGESITTISSNIICGKGSPAGGGGGGLAHNSGGGGGANAGSGGFGGYQLQPCGNAPFDNRGIGGKQLAYSSAANKIYMGSGGGAGQADNPGNIPPAGGNGAGIVIISADKVRSNSRKILANGAVGLACTIPASPDCHDGMGGGGAGGTILLSVNQFLDNSLVEIKGGNGANMVGSVAAGGRIGAGGGGGGGLAFLKPATIPANLAITNSGGANGVLTTDGNSAWGTTPGTAGQNLFSLVLPIDQVPFQKNIDSVRIKDSVLNCNGFDFKGLAYTNTNPIASWQWYFGDGNTANTQNTTHAYGAAGTYTVKLVVTDINGCKDSIMKDVVALPGIVANAGLDTSFCSNSTVSHVLQGSGNGTYSWSPAIYLNDPTLQNPTATISSTTTFYLTVTGGSACASVDSVTIFVNPLPLVQTLPDTSICKLSPLVLTTTNGAGTYQWSPGIYVSDSTIASPVFIDTLPRMLVVTRTNAAGCFAKDTININIKPLPAVKTIEDTLICSINPLTLFTNGAQTYSWSPAIFLSDPNIANPVYSGNQTQTYFVTGTGINGCTARDTVTVNVNMPMVLRAPPDKTMCNQSSVQLDGFNGSSVDYLWSPATYLSSTTIINPISTTPASTIYSVIITDRACNYDSSFNVNVFVLPAPVVNAGKSNDIDCAFRSATLNASGGDQYTWSPATGLSNPNIPNPVATPAGTQQYIVRVTNGAGCANADTVTVFVNNTASLARYMPNAFTPDGNGRNDCYGLKNWMYIKQLQFFIFNRYGEQVFATSNPNTCWDGVYKGKPALAGTYVFVIKAQTDCGVEEQKGSFILIR